MSDLLRADALTSANAPNETGEWIDVCPARSVGVDRGVAALIAGEPVAIFRLAAPRVGDDVGDQWYAVDHIDPKTGAPVIARGLVGSTVLDGIEVPTVAAPLYKQRYDLTTGLGIDGEVTELRTWPVECVDERVRVFSVEMSRP